jgi:hypothetical protein
MEFKQSDSASASAKNDQPEFQTMPPKERSKLPLVLLIVFIAVLVIGGGVFAYYKLYLPNAAPKISPQEILQNSIQASMDVRSLSFDVKNTAEISTEKDELRKGIPTAVNFVFSASGAIDFNSLDALLFDVVLDMTMEAEESAADIESHASGTLGINAVYAQKNLYLNLKEFDVSYESSDPESAGVKMSTALVDGFAESLKGKWIKIDATKAIMIATTSQSAFSEENKIRIREYLSSMSYVKTVDKVGDETINEIQTYHLKVSIEHDQEELADLTEKLVAEKYSADSEYMNEFNKQRDNFLKSVSQKIDIDLWIGKDDFLIYKIVTSPITISDPEAEIKIVISHEAGFGDYNEPVSVVIPQDTLPLEEILKSLFGSMFRRSQ